MIACFLRLVLRFLLAGLCLIRPVLLSFRTRHGARFFLRGLRIYSSLYAVPRGRTRGPGRSVVLVSGCWATVESIAAPSRRVPQRSKRRCCCGVSHVGHAWVSHTAVCCLRVRYDGRWQQGMSLHRLRTSHVIARGVDVRCFVNDAVSDTASTPVLLCLGDRTPAPVLLFTVIA